MTALLWVVGTAVLAAAPRQQFEAYGEYPAGVLSADGERLATHDDGVLIVYTLEDKSFQKNASWKCGSPVIAFSLDAQQVMCMQDDLMLFDLTARTARTIMTHEEILIETRHAMVKPQLTSLTFTGSTGVAVATFGLMSTLLIRLAPDKVSVTSVPFPDWGVRRAVLSSDRKLLAMSSPSRLQVVRCNDTELVFRHTSATMSGLAFWRHPTEPQDEDTVVFTNGSGLFKADVDTWDVSLAFSGNFTGFVGFSNNAQVFATAEYSWDQVSKRDSYIPMIYETASGRNLVAGVLNMLEKPSLSVSVADNSRRGLWVSEIMAWNGLMEVLDTPGFRAVTPPPPPLPAPDCDTLIYTRREATSSASIRMSPDGSLIAACNIATQTLALLDATTSDSQVTFMPCGNPSAVFFSSNTTSLIHKAEDVLLLYSIESMSPLFYWNLPNTIAAGFHQDGAFVIAVSSGDGYRVLSLSTETGNSESVEVPGGLAWDGEPSGNGRPIDLQGACLSPDAQLIALHTYNGTTGVLTLIRASSAEILWIRSDMPHSFNFTFFHSGSGPFGLVYTTPFEIVNLDLRTGLILANRVFFDRLQMLSLVGLSQGDASVVQYIPPQLRVTGLDSAADGIICTALLSNIKSITVSADGTRAAVLVGTTLFTFSVPHNPVTGAPPTSVPATLTPRSCSEGDIIAQHNDPTRAISFSWANSTLHFPVCTHQSFFGMPVAELMQAVPYEIYRFVGAPTNGCQAVAITSDHIYVAWAHGVEVTVKNVLSYRETEMPTSSSADVVELALSPDDELLAGMDSEGRTTVWRRRDGGVVKEIPSSDPNASPGRGLVFSEDGRRLAVPRGASGGFYDTQAWVEVASADNTPRSSFALSWDFTTIALPGKNGAVVRNVTTGDVLVELVTTEPARSLKFSPDGSLVVTSHLSAFLVVWDVATGQQMQELCLQNGNFFSASISFVPDGSAVGVATGVNWVLFNLSGLPGATFAPDTAVPTALPSTAAPTAVPTDVPTAAPTPTPPDTDTPLPSTALPHGFRFTMAPPTPQPEEKSSMNTETIVVVAVLSTLAVVVIAVIFYIRRRSSAFQEARLQAVMEEDMHDMNGTDVDSYSSAGDGDYVLQGDYEVAL